eukprot:1593231-Alexandrium_andersonii.AAC.1
MARQHAFLVESSSDSLDLPPSQPRPDWMDAEPPQFESWPSDADAQSRSGLYGPRVVPPPPASWENAQPAIPEQKAGDELPEK